MTGQRSSRATVWSRREAMRILGLGGAGLAAACGRPPETAPPTESAAPVGPSFPEGAIVRTILEDVPPDRLSHGAVLFHEHMSLDLAFWDRLLGADNPGRERFIGPSDSPYFMQDVDVMAAELEAAAREGVAALVDGGHDDMGRSVAFLREVSERSGMPIVASGGYYTDPFHPPELADRSEDEIAEALAGAAAGGAVGGLRRDRQLGRDHAVGAQGIHGRRPGPPAHEPADLHAYRERRGRRGAARPLRGARGARRGAWPSAISAGSTTPRRRSTGASPRAARSWASTGSGGGPDADGRKVPMIQALIADGHADRVLLASDFAAAEDIQRNGGPGYARTITRFVPMLREAGVTDDEIRAMTVDNPLRFLAFVPPA